MNTSLHIIGTGGHAKVVIDALPSSQPISCVNTISNRSDERCLGHVVHTLDDVSDISLFHVAIGDNHIRMKMANNLMSHSKYHTVIHSRAVISTYSSIGDGSFIAATAVVSTEAIVGLGGIINHGAVVDHESQTGSFVHIAPGAKVLGHCWLGDLVFIGAGSIVLPGIQICSRVTVGAGSVVTKNISSPGVYCGTPAKFMRASNG